MKMLVQWTHDLDTGFNDVDSQHLLLVDGINKFYDASEDGNFEKAKAELQALIDVTIFHFREEEEMLEKAQYRLLAQHKKVHQHFVEKMQALQSRYNFGDAAAKTELYDLLEGWLFRHIRLNDHGYVEDVKKSGVVTHTH